MRIKGLTRQATLLETRAGPVYLLTLLQKRWEQKVVDSIGEDAFYELTAEFIRNLGLLKIKNALDDCETFTPKEVGMNPLEIEVKGNVDTKSVRKAGKIYDELERLASEGSIIIASELKERIYDDEDMIYRIYKDSDSSYESRDFFYNALFNRTERCKRMFDMDAPTDILVDQIRIVNDLTGPGDAGSRRAFKELEACCREMKDADNEDMHRLKGIFEESSSTIIGIAESVLRSEQQDPGSNDHLFSSWIAERKRTARERVIDNERRLMDFEPDPLEREFMRNSSDELIVEAFLENELLSEAAYEENSDTDRLVGILMKSPIQCRQYFIDMRNSFLNRFRNASIGFKQILEGGPVTNPEATEVSSMQNHAGFANIKYSDDTKQELERIVEQMDELFRQLPDISALPTPSKLKRKRHLKYIMEEMPKDPTDITFGNDSGCCIFVDEDREKIHNGTFVPAYLLHPEVRIFGLYRVEGDKRQRMGMVLAFETGYEDNREGKVLACNSLELSRLGIAGGNETVEKLVDYAEDWLAAYAKENGYDGACMGRHSYNTSVNYSSKTGETVDETLTFRNFPLMFYSDILQTRDEHSMATRDDSCYWLWRK